MEDHLQYKGSKDHYRVENALQRLNSGNSDRNGTNDKFNMQNMGKKEAKMRQGV